ncbi:hypothetical protein CEXT_270481 [Caerostris extrusa]|uniref:Uncharacterized protein n=1 Tax=Caerostris extrusa TaxID=172846 RepID=A0AAV4XRF3_CAEEX|nr:hypothetical protein CEXT_270481 [Caerostris extrusa]
MIGMIGETLGSTCPWQTYNDNYYFNNFPLSEFFPFSGTAPTFSQNTSQTIPNIYPPLKWVQRHAKILRASCLSAACKEIVGNSNISFIQGNIRALNEGDSGGSSQSNDLISSPGNPWRENRK